MPRRLTNTPAVQSATPRPVAPPATPSSSQVTAGWKPGPKGLTADQRQLVSRTLNAAIELPPGASPTVRLGHARAVLTTLGTKGTRAAAEHLASRLPAPNEEVRARVFKTAQALGALTPTLRRALAEDAVKAGDAKVALELVSGGTTLTAAQRTALAPHLSGDGVLLSDDATVNLARAAVQVLADQPAALRRFAASLSTPALLFTEVLANHDRALMPALRPLVPMLAPREAASLAALHPRSALNDALQTRAAERR